MSAEVRCSHAAPRTRQELLPAAAAAGSCSGKESPSLLCHTHEDTAAEDSAPSSLGAISHPRTGIWFIQGSYSHGGLATQASELRRGIGSGCCFLRFRAAAILAVWINCPHPSCAAACSPGDADPLGFRQSHTASLRLVTIFG